MTFRVILSLMAVLFLQTPIVLAQSGELETELRQHVLGQYDAWNRGDLASINLGWARGFGFRSAAARTRSSLPKQQARELLGRFFKRMERYRIEPGELHVEIVGDIGLVWGFHIEDFQISGKSPERIRVRTSSTYRWTKDGTWETLLTHRDIQSFDGNARYIPNY